MSVAVCKVSDLESGAAKRFDVEGHRIALVRINDDFYAIGDKCSHADVSLAMGDVFEKDCEIECWKHGSTFSLKTGLPSNLPAIKPVPVYTVSVDGDDVKVELP